MKALAQRVAGLFFMTLGASHAMAQSPNHVYINDIHYAGSGCPAGSVSQSISADQKAFSLGLEAMIAESGPGVPLSEGRKNCQIAVDLRYPAGWSYAVDTTEFRGYVNLAPDAQAKIRTSFYFQGMATQATVSDSFNGPANRQFVIHDTLGESALVWSPCNAQRGLNVNIQAQITNPGTSSALLALYEPVEGSLSTFQIRWRRC